MNMAFEEFTHDAQRFENLSAYYLAEESSLLGELCDISQLSQVDRQQIMARAQGYVENIRSDDNPMQLMDAFLQEYGLSTSEGVTLMRLSEALIRTPDFLTARTLIRDKIGTAKWSGHAGASDRFIVNRATTGLRLSATWIKMTGGVDATNLAAKLGDQVLAMGVRQAMEIMGEHFVLGRTIEKAAYKASKNERAGFLHSYDMLGEAAYTAQDADIYFNAYLKAVQHLVDSAPHPYTSMVDAPGISVKLSALHPRYEYVKRADCVPALTERIRKLALVAKSAGLGLTIDAEEADRLEVSLLIIDALLEDSDLADWDGLGIVVQAYQRRAIPVLRNLIETARTANRKIAIRLVKGAYWDMEIKRAQELGLESYPVFTRKEHTDISYLACARLLLEAGDHIYPQFATHNAHTAAAIAHIAGDNRTFEFQRLHGMGEVLHQNLVKDIGVRSRIYAPVGDHKDLLPYLVRRLLENGANSSFVNQLFDIDTSIDEIVADPIATAEAHEFSANVLIGAPRDMFNGRRDAALGVDLTQALITSGKSRAVHPTDTPYLATSIVNGEAILTTPEPAKNPADLSTIIGDVHSGNIDTVDSAIAIAAQSSWHKKFTASERAACLNRAALLLEEEMDDFLRLCVLEAGKTLPDAVAEVREAVDFCRYYANQAQSEKMSERSPLGVIACISPWNFPLAIFLGQIVASLSVGNTVVAKPAQQTPLVSEHAVRLLFRAGVPTDAIQLLIGEGAALGGRLTNNPNIAGVCFTGSTATAKRIALSLAETGRADTPFIAETGGINAMIIDSTALLEQAVQDVIASAFQSAGQRCSACRLVVVQEDIADAFITMLAGAVDELEIGDPSKLSTDIGPVIDIPSQKMIETYAAEMKTRHKLIAEKRPDNGIEHQGHFVAASAFEVENISDLKKEVFGPVLHVVRFAAQTIDATIDEINALGFGLTMGLHTRLDERVEQIAAKAHVGNLYVNRNQIGAVVGVQPFGGEGLSGTGPKAGGPHYLLRLSKKSSTPMPALTPLKHTSKYVLGAQEIEIIRIANKGQKEWIENFSAAERRQYLHEVFTTIGQMSDDVLSAMHVNRRIELPGPTGEENRLTLHPRGVLCCFPSDDISTASHQLAQALITGNSVIVASTENIKKHIEDIRSALHQRGTPEGLVVMAPPAIVIPVTDGSIAGVIAEPTERADIADRLCRREGAILPLLSSTDDPHRFCHERTVTINTTAAGGNASLLAMS